MEITSEPCSNGRDWHPGPDSMESEEISNLHHDFLPLEIWLRIFPELAAPDLRASTLTCSSFRFLAQPLLFRVFDVSPFFLAYNTDRRILRPRKYLDRTLERLEFYRSKHIAPAVRHCWISPYSRTGFPPRNHRDYLEPHLIINAVVGALPSFVNLAKLSWHCTDLTADWWDVIRKLSIKTLWLNSCTVEGYDLPSFPIEKLDLDQWAWEGEVTDRVSIHEEHSHGVSGDVLPLLLHSDHIKHISVPREDTSHRLLSIIARMDTLRSLSIIRIPLAAMASPNFIGALVQCPTLEELRIFNPTDEQPRDIMTHALPPSTVPALSVYEGPYTHLLDFAAGRSLKRIYLWGMDESTSLCDPDILLETLDHLSALNHTLETLQMSVSRITPELVAILLSFPFLKSVSMESADNPPRMSPPPAYTLQSGSRSAISALYNILRNTTLPHGLEKLRIATKLHNSNLDTPTQKLEAQKLIEELARAARHLRAVDIAYGTYWTGTYSAKWTRVESTHDSDLLGKMSFNEHRRTIVFPVSHSEFGWNQEKHPHRSGLFSIFIWLRQQLHGYL